MRDEHNVAQERKLWLRTTKMHGEKDLASAKIRIPKNAQVRESESEDKSSLARQNLDAVLFNETFSFSPTHRHCLWMFLKGYFILVRWKCQIRICSRTFRRLYCHGRPLVIAHYRLLKESFFTFTICNGISFLKIVAFGTQSCGVLFPVMARARNKERDVRTDCTNRTVSTWWYVAPVQAGRRKRTYQHTYVLILDTCIFLPVH